MTLVEFLEARIAEDEAEAKPMAGLDDDDRGGWAIVYAERVLAECAAKRAILEMHGPVKDEGWKSGEDNDFLWCGSCGSIDDSPWPYPCGTLQALAAVYADHPDYQQEWAL